MMAVVAIPISLMAAPLAHADRAEPARARPARESALVIAAAAWERRHNLGRTVMDDIRWPAAPARVKLPTVPLVQRPVRRAR